MCATHWPSAIAAAALVCLAGGLARPAAGAIYTPEMVANARRNVERYAWAKTQRDSAVNAAARWVELEDDELWALVPGQKLPRTIDVTMTRGKRTGCLNCGDDIFTHGNYPYKPDCLELPWKVKCPSCGEVYPKNDFGAYYRSALDEQGLFDPELGDRSLLFNAEHPDPNDPLHGIAVDDGFGYQDEAGFEHRFIAYYAHWGLWSKLLSAVGSLSTAYLLSGDTVYAHKCGILLARIADVYPDMDWAPYANMGWFHSDGGSGLGKVQGRIWETGTISTLVEACDRIRPGVADDAALFAFLAGKAEQYKLATPVTDDESFCQHLDDHILREGAAAVMDRHAWGNEGMHQSAIARCAIALDREPETSEWLDWIFDPQGGGIPGTIVGQIDRDGVGAEAAPGYALSWGSNIGALADLLADYQAYDTHDIYRDYPQFRQTFTAGSRILVLGYVTPNIGDSGSTGSIGKVQADPSFILRGYRYTGRPELALAAWQANGDSAEGLRGSIFDPEPEGLAEEIEAVARRTAASPSRTDHMPGYGLASLEVGSRKPGTAAYMYYGRNRGHGHQDRLSIGLYAFGVDLMPDLGYPEFATRWPKRGAWTSNTLSHNALVVNGSRQKSSWVGHPRFFKSLPMIRAVEVDSEDVYEEATEYRRLLALVPTGSGGYVLDVFRCAGGEDHLLSYHGHEGAVSTDGLALTPQPGGTYAGIDVPFGTEISGPGDAYPWLYDVQRDDAPPAKWTVDWHIDPKRIPQDGPEDVHLRLWSLSQVDDVALASGDPPQNKPRNPRRLTYVLAHRSSPTPQSTFVSVLEPYAGTPLIADVEPLLADSGSAAVRVTLADGAVDYLLTCADPSAEIAVPGGPVCAGALGFLRVRDGLVEQAALIGGTRLGLGDFSLTAEADAHQGVIEDFDRGMDDDNRVYIGSPLPADDLVGEEIIIQNDRLRNACYRIEGVEQKDGRTAVNLGDLTFVRGFADPQDYKSGYVYNFDAGAPFRIPNHVCATKRPNGVWEVLTTCECKLSEPKAGE